MSETNRATGPELDALVAIKVMDWKVVETYVHGPLMHGGGMAKVWAGRDIPFANGTIPTVESWRPSVDMGQAWEVVKRLVADGYDVDIRYSTGALASPDPADMPAAICYLALDAKESQHV